MPSEWEKIPRLIIVGSGKGGVGKTLLTTTSYAVINLLLGLHTEVIQIDSQDRLARTLKAKVTSILVDDLRATRSDLAAGVRAFRPVGQWLERQAAVGGALLIDIGATQVDRALTYFELADLADDLRDLNYETHVLVPVVAEPEAISQAAHAIRRFREVLPAAQVTLVENRRDGRLADLANGTATYRLAEEQLIPALEGRPALIMPAIEGGSWQQFEQCHLAPLDVVAMDIAEVMKITGLPRGEARIARGDVAAYLATMNDQLEKLFAGEGGRA